jgi:hypothetical protein
MSGTASLTATLAISHGAGSQSHDREVGLISSSDIKDALESSVCGCRVYLYIKDTRDDPSSFVE